MRRRQKELSSGQGKRGLYKHTKTKERGEDTQKKGKQETGGGNVFFGCKGVDQFFHIDAFAVKRQGICHGISYCLSLYLKGSFFPNRDYGVVLGGWPGRLTREVELARNQIWGGQQLHILLALAKYSIYG